MSYMIGLRCKECGQKYPKEALYVCEYCFGSLEVEYDYEGIRKVLTKDKIANRARNLWRYGELLPIKGKPTDGLHSGFTPLVKANNLGKDLGVKELYLKDDTVNYPTLSYKDRVVPVALSRAKELGFDTVGCATTGNLGNALAAHAAIANLKRFIFIPAGLEVGKIIGSLIYAPTVVAVEGTYDEVNRLCTEISSKYNWAFVNVNLRPYYTEGAKTCGFEIAEQLGWRAPKHLVAPVAGGTLLPKIWKGLNELKHLGLIDTLDTKIYAAQAQGCAPVVEAIKERSEIIVPVKQPQTIAKSLAIGNPADGYYVIEAVNESGGWGEVASDEEIVEAIKQLAKTEGIFTEPAGGVTLAVAKKLIEGEIIPKEESIVVCITGNGLKTQEAVTKSISEPIKIKPTVHSFEQELKHHIKRGEEG